MLPDYKNQATHRESQRSVAALTPPSEHEETDSTSTQQSTYKPNEQTRSLSPLRTCDEALDLSTRSN
ncbi:hypothetical protein PC118_g6338 [Phytophthora cactorum]|uniref:Uncharacterized protein n=1 Tax=Phytophthora cactorum TaxID=29920 RepID=A0A8T1GHY4_9STRA|nr:hypothetical protein PC118_g6338 [Phytophthora cactorum]